MAIWSDRHASVCEVVIMVSTMCTKSSPIVCTPLTVVYHGELDPLQGPPLYCMSVPAN